MLSHPLNNALTSTEQITHIYQTNHSHALNKACTPTKHTSLTHVNENIFILGGLPRTHDLSSVTLFPRALVTPQIPRKCLLSPRALHWITYWRESGNGLVCARILESDGEGAVASLRCCMYVRVYVYVRMYVCMYVCMDVCM